jgi:rubrerythrin
MKNNYWEELNMTDDIYEFHEKSLEKMGLPDWANIACPHCSAIGLPLTSIRSISLKLNTRNKGDIAIEICCDECRLMDTVYFRNQASNMSEFIELVAGDKAPDCSPVVEEDMYKLQYNNVMEDMIVKRGDKMSMVKRGTCSSKVVVSEMVYSCPECGHTEILSSKDEADETKANCPHCEDVVMSLIASSSGAAEEDNA